MEKAVFTSSMRDRKKLDEIFPSVFSGMLTIAMKTDQYLHSGLSRETSGLCFQGEKLAQS